MNDDLKWLAENVSEWPDYAKSVYLGIIDGEPTEIFLSVPKKFVWEYDKGQWKVARVALGLEDDSIASLEVTPEEEACWKEQDAKASDCVNHPPHYQLREGYEVYDLRQDLAAKAQTASIPYDQYSDWDRVLEYVLRMWEKNGVEDAKKAGWYLNKLIGKLEK